MCNRFIFFSQSWDEVDWILLKLSAELPKPNCKNSKKTKLGRDYIQLCNIASGADNTLPILSAWISTTCIPIGQLCRLIQVTIEGCQCSHCGSSTKRQTTNGGSLSSSQSFFLLSIPTQHDHQCYNTQQALLLLLLLHQRVLLPMLFWAWESQNLCRCYGAKREEEETKQSLHMRFSAAWEITVHVARC